MTKYHHETVLKKEAIDYLVHDPKGVYIDATCGGGGHSEEMLSRFPDITVVACDWDKNALEAGYERLAQYGDRVFFEVSSFAHLYRVCNKHDLNCVSGILADFGTSKYQIENTPGFSFSRDAHLDMRMSKSHTRITAAHLIAKKTEEELADIFYIYGEERFSRRIARAIVKERGINPITTTVQLAKLIEGVVPKRGKIHPATRVFQALRIAVNGELDQIKKLMQQSEELLCAGGRLVTIAFHSLEDRIVKHFAREHKESLPSIVKKVIVPSDEEVNENPASRSAKMRVLEKKY